MCPCGHQKGEHIVEGYLFGKDFVANASADEQKKLTLGYRHAHSQRTADAPSGGGSNSGGVPPLTGMRPFATPAAAATTTAEASRRSSASAAASLSGGGTQRHSTSSVEAVGNIKSSNFQNSSSSTSGSWNAADDEYVGGSGNSTRNSIFRAQRQSAGSSVSKRFYGDGTSIGRGPKKGRSGGGSHSYDQHQQRGSSQGLPPSRRLVTAFFTDQPTNLPVNTHVLGEVANPRVVTRRDFDCTEGAAAFMRATNTLSQQLKDSFDDEGQPLMYVFLVKLGRNAVLPLPTGLSIQGYDSVGGGQQATDGDETYETKLDKILTEVSDPKNKLGLALSATILVNQAVITQL